MKGFFVTHDAIFVEDAINKFFGSRLRQRLCMIYVSFFGFYTEYRCSPGPACFLSMLRNAYYNLWLCQRFNLFGSFMFAQRISLLLDKVIL